LKLVQKVTDFVRSRGRDGSRIVSPTKCQPCTVMKFPGYRDYISTERIKVIACVWLCGTSIADTFLFFHATPHPRTHTPNIRTFFSRCPSYSKFEISSTLHTFRTSLRRYLERKNIKDLDIR